MLTCQNSLSAGMPSFMMLLMTFHTLIDLPCLTCRSRQNKRQFATRIICHLSNAVPSHQPMFLGRRCKHFSHETLPPSMSFTFDQWQERSNHRPDTRHPSEIFDGIVPGLHCVILAIVSLINHVFIMRMLGCFL